jgi:hypothetical protein
LKLQKVAHTVRKGEITDKAHGKGLKKSDTVFLLCWHENDNISAKA